MIRKWHTMALPVLAFAIAMSGALPTKVWSEEAELLRGEEVEFLPSKMLSITIGATVLHLAGKEIHRVNPVVTPFIDIDEDGAELGLVAVVAPTILNLVEGQKYQLKIVNASASTHYFRAPEFDELSVKTTPISVDKGKVRSKVTGGPEEEYLTAETEIRPGGTAVWEFVPQMAGKFKWGCSIPSHAKAGIKGEIMVAPAMTG